MGVEKESNISEIEDDQDDEEPGEVIESAPPLKIGEERDIHPASGLHLKKKLLKRGHGWETPKLRDQVTVHYVGSLLDGSKFASTRDNEEPLTMNLGDGVIVAELDHGILTMKKGEVALFTIPSNPGYGNVPSDSGCQFEVELLDWITVVDISSDGGIIKKVIVKGEKNDQPGDLDEVTVKYQVMLEDGTLVANTPEEGVEFCVQDGYFCPAIPKAVKTMKRGEKIQLIIQPQYAFAEHGLTADNGSLTIPANSVLNIHLELVSFKPVIDVTHDAKVLKKILKEGEGSHTADEGATVHVRYTARLEDGTIFEKKGFDEDEFLEFVVDEEQVIAGLDRAAATMRKGEISIVTVKPDYGYSTTEFQGDLAIVPSSSVLVYDIEMVDFTKEKLPSEMNNHERVEAAEKKKEEGNMLFKNGKYQRATRKYDKAAAYIVDDGDFEGGDEKLTKSLRVSCWLNHAACSLKLNHFQDAINLCSKVLEIDSGNVKALYRRAQAFISTSDLDLSELDIKKALEIDPHNRELISLRHTLKQVQSERNKEDAKLYANMFAPRRSWVSPMETKRQKVEIFEDENTDCSSLHDNEDNVSSQ
ncbi:peptidylprolyl isomerase [Ranunculus cassubicifolius]